MSPSLTALNGPEPGRSWELSEERSVLGRHPDCNVVIDVNAVSRFHAHIVAEGGGYFVEDLASRNGTFLNNQQLDARAPLKDGDEVRVSEIAFAFASGNGSPAPPLPAQASRPAGNRAAGPAQFLAGDDSVQAVFVDGPDGEASSVMSKFDVSALAGGKLQASAEAKLSALLEINRHLGQAVTLDTVLPQVLSALFDIFMQADRGFIALLDDADRLAPRWTKVRRGDDETIRISRTICNTVIESKEAILSADAASDERFELSQSIYDFRIRSMICAPLVSPADGTAFGCLQLDTLDQRKRFQQEDLEVLAAVAMQAAVAIENAKMHEQAIHQRELERDLEVAREVQHSFLPGRPATLPGYGFYDYYEPANKVGGDYYDYIPLPDGRLAVVVADVVGHGVAAALLMAKLAAETRYSLAAESDPAAAVTRLNNAICALDIEQFVTFVMTVIDPSDHTATMVSAGHMSPIVRRGVGMTEEPATNTGGLPLGIVDGVDYEQATVSLQTGDVVVLFTDGINEAEDSTGDDYSIDRLRLHAGGASADPEKLGQVIVDDVRKHIDGLAQFDDMCLVCFGRDGA